LSSFLPFLSYSIDEVFFFEQYWGVYVSFLKRNIATLQQRAKQALTFISGFQGKVVSGLAEGTSSLTDVLNLAAHTSFHQALSDFASYSITGNPEQLSTARSKLHPHSAVWKPVFWIEMIALITCFVMF